MELNYVKGGFGVNYMLDNFIQRQQKIYIYSCDLKIWSVM